jgi:hypothetical protein
MKDKTDFFVIKEKQINEENYPTHTHTHTHTMQTYGKINMDAYRTMKTKND